MDYSSFSCLFSEISHSNFDKNENEILIKSYKLKDERYLSKNNLIPSIILKIQEILKLKVENPNSNIQLIHNHFKNAVIKMNLKNNLTFIDLFMNNSIERIGNVVVESKKVESTEDLCPDINKNINNISHLAFDYYILKKSECIFFFIFFTKFK